MGMTAQVYKELYRNLQVPIVGDDDKVTGLQPVDVHKYLLNNLITKGPPEHYNVQNATNGLGTLESKVNDHFSKAKASLTVFVGPSGKDAKTFNSKTDVLYFAKKAYLGKGCPEEVQITLQLVLRFKMATPETLQDYCDQGTDDLAQGRIGLDCNGFVGNFIDHGLHDKKWDSVKVGFSDYTANNGIKDTMDTLGPEVKRIGDIDPLQIYAMGRVDPATNQVINQHSGTLTGHMVVTTPFSIPVMWDNKATYQLQVVESTHNVGLTQSEYILLSGSNSVFEVRRGSKVGTDQERISVRIRPIV